MMKLLFALSLIVTTVSANAKAQYVQRLLSKANPTADNQLARRLDEETAVQETAFEENIADYSVKFEQCQVVNTSRVEFTNVSTIVYERENSVLFRLCPNGDCTTCTSNYSEYSIGLDSYLQSTAEYYQAYEEAMCEACKANCTTADENTAVESEEAVVGDDGGRRRRELGTNKFYNIVTDCTVCVDECDKYENMEANSHIDALNFLECTMIYDPEDDDFGALYGGPICASGGTKIKIGVFKDENCMYYDETREIDTYLQADGVSFALNNLLLKRTYTDTCISCKEQAEQNENAEGDITEDADNVVEVCEQLYSNAEYLAPLQSNTSTLEEVEGESVVSSAYGQHGISILGGQVFALTVFILGTVGFAV